MLVTSTFSPDPTGIAVYTSGLARLLADEGDHVTVVTGMPHYPSWRLGEAPRDDHPGIDVRRHRHYVPRRQTALRRAAYEACFLAGGLRLARRGPRPDVVIGVSPCLASAHVALAAGRAHGVPVGIVFQDLLGRAAAEAGVRGGERLVRPTAKLERAAASGASAVAVTSPGFASFFDREVVNLRNWADRTAPDLDRAGARARLGWREDEFVCLHAGNMGQKQSLDSVIDAARTLGRRGIRMVLAGDGNDRRRLERRGRGVVSFEGVQPAGEFEAMLGAADVLLVSQRASVRGMSLASRLTAYFAAGRPVVAAASPGSEVAAEVRRSGAGVLVRPEDPEALVQTLVSLYEAPARRAALGAAGSDYAARELTPGVVLPHWSGFVSSLDPGRAPPVPVEPVAA
jgi:glycosyltransferase involved in cell wall biosynthesis